MSENRIPIVGDRVKFNEYNGNFKPGTCTAVYENDPEHNGQTTIDMDVDDPLDVSKNHLPFGTEAGTYGWLDEEARAQDNTNPNNPPPPRP